VDPDDDPDRGVPEPLAGEEDGEGDPDERVDEVLDVTGLRGREQRAVA